MKSILLLSLLVAIPTYARPRARDLGIPFGGSTGRLNAITDVGGVEVGHTTLIQGEGPLVVGKGPVRTGVTMILPRGRGSDAPVFAATFALNGTGEMTGTAFIEEYGVLEGPIALTNSQSVGTVRDAVAQWLVREKKWELCCLPVVAETFDGYLNDIHGFHVRAEHVLAAIDRASSGAVAEGSVGGGTGMVAFHVKGGIGTSSRQVRTRFGSYTIGVLVQANMSGMRQLVIAGIPVGERLMEKKVAEAEGGERDTGSIISCRTSSSGWPAARPSVSPEPARSAAILPATSFSRSPPPTPNWSRSPPVESSGCCRPGCCRTQRWIRSSRGPFRPWRRRS
jgi:L-aminopeptidase/D-esterase-like protein